MNSCSAARENSDGARQHEPFSCRELIFMVKSDELMSYFNLYRKSPGVRFNSELE